MSGDGVGRPHGGLPGLPGTGRTSLQWVPSCSDEAAAHDCLPSDGFSVTGALRWLAARTHSPCGCSFHSRTVNCSSSSTSSGSVPLCSRIPRMILRGTPMPMCSR